MNKKISKISSIATLVSLILAILIGLFLPNIAIEIKFLGDWYIKILKIIISPTIFFSMSLAILNNKKTKNFLITKSILLFLIMFILTFLISSLFIFIFQPGQSFETNIDGTIKNLADFSLSSILKNLLPNDLESFLTGGNIFFVIVLTLVISFAISKTKFSESYKNKIEFCKEHLDKFLSFVILTTPIAVLSLVSNMIINNTIDIFNMGLKYILFAYGLSIIALILVMILPVWIIAKVNPITYIKKVSRIWLITISSCSSAATLPFTIKTCNEEFGIDEKITNVVVPLGCTIHMCGGAVSFSLLGLFVAQMTGANVTLSMFLLMLLFATLINMAAPGIPGGGKVIGFTYLSLFGFDLNVFYGLYVAIYNFLDMAYTTLNVTGDITANIILNKIYAREKTETQNIE